MAKFKVGDRTKIIDQSPMSLALHGNMLGMQVTIVSFDSKLPDLYDIVVNVDGLRGDWHTKQCRLAPLTDPNAEWATEQVRKLFKMPVAA